MKRLLCVLPAVLLVGLSLAMPNPVAAAAPLGPPEISWDMASPDVVRFHLRFSNPDPYESTLPTSGRMLSQEFGVFLMNYGWIGSLDVPPIEPESFFDVYFDVPLTSLPPSPGGLVSGASEAPLVVCPPPIWVGNVHVIWGHPDQHVYYHFGNVGVCPGGAASCIHVLTGSDVNLTWAINNPCPPGWTVTLENEDHTPAPAVLPALWTGWICVTASANIPIGSQCSPSVDFWRFGVKATINVCAYACPCDVGVEQNSWGRVKHIYR